MKKSKIVYTSTIYNIAMLLTCLCTRNDNPTAKEYSYIIDFDILLHNES